MRLPSCLCVALVAGTLLSACTRGSYAEPEDDAPLPSAGGTSGGAASGGSAAVPTGGSMPSAPLPQDTDFALRPEFDGPCQETPQIDVNLGHAPEAFVRAAQCQITGTEPAAATVADLSAQLRTDERLRRIDVVRTLCQRAARICSLRYSDPWQDQVELTEACTRKGARELGAVLMYWSDCPGGVNCGMDWANTHAVGMLEGQPSRLLGFEGKASGYYNPRNPGFWRREFLDARWAGLQFLLLNTFGPDLAQLGPAVQALEQIGGGIQVALFDDTWGWGRGAPPWNELPSFDNSEAAAQLIYQKWQTFYRSVPMQHWYRYQGKPLIAFYNAGTLKPENKSAATLARLKELFQAEFGEEPFLAVDRAFFQDAATASVADSQFRWNTFSNNELSRSELNGVKFDHFMVKWDELGRRGEGSLPQPDDLLVKGPELLERYLGDSAGSDLAVIATWNDLGEGTGIARNYDYYYLGQWLPPHAFLTRIRASQCQ